MYRTEQKVLERERDIERVYYPNETFAPRSSQRHHFETPRQGTLQQQGVVPQRTITNYPAGATIITSYPIPLSNNQQGQMPANVQINPNNTNQGVGYAGGTSQQFQQQPMGPPGGGGTLGRRGDTLPRRGGGGGMDDNRSECRSCSVCSSERSIAEDAYRAKKRHNILRRAFPVAALLCGLMICISFINWVGIWTPFWLLARNPFLIYPVTSTTTVNTGVGGIGGSGIGGAGQVPILLNPQTVQPPGGRVGIGNPIFGHLGIWAYCAPRSFCVTYPYGRSRPYGFFSAAAFSLSLAGLGGFFTQLFGGPLLNNLVGGLGFGGGLPGALGPGFTGLGGFGGGFGKRKKRWVSPAEDLYQLIARAKRDVPPQQLQQQSNVMNNANVMNTNRNYGLNPLVYDIRQQNAPASNNKAQTNARDQHLASRNGLETSKALTEFHPFSYYYDQRGSGLNQKYVDFLKNGKIKDALTSNTNRLPAVNVNGILERPSRRISPTNDPQAATPIRNNRNLALTPGIMDGGQGMMDPMFGGGLGSLGVGGLGALGMGAFGNRFSGINGLLGSQQALVAFALLQPGPEGLPLPENFLFALPGSISPFAYFRNRIRENIAWFISVQTLVGIGFALNLLGFVFGIVYLCTYFSKVGRTIGKLAALLLFLAAIFELLGICVFIAKVRLDRNAFFHIDPAFVIHSGVGWAFYLSLAGAILLLVVSILMLWESSMNS